MVNHPHHRFCNYCYKNEKKANQDDEDDDHLGSTDTNEVRGKQNDKRKKKCTQAAVKKSEQAQSNDPFEQKLFETKGHGGNSNESVLLFVSLDLVRLKARLKTKGHGGNSNESVLLFVPLDLAI